ncbi:hypothetical protein EST38_g3406 [Candolleomyces aberdarensis]|uniref:Uncharacterized protein n=1 Tax=Candolleomyces aberdarensis TaxID=2316362 RepID=A0A4Q2DQM9_9AGAR|nr:hypothetical protein EST38_g3406 [Candolleomyces aberdarensis]
MFKSFALVSLVATAVWAQSIPSGISQGCSSFLTELNNNTELAKCTGALTTALSAFAPGASASASAVTSALTDVCSESVTASCPSSVFASAITSFYSACSAELTQTPVEDLVKVYDLVYVLPAYRAAICSKGDDGNWCVASAAPIDGTTASTIQSALYTQTGDDIVPNTATFSTYNLPFLLIGPDSPNLCQTCTRNVLNAYIQHESSLPYAPGLGQSQLLNKQSALFAAVQEKCGASFMDNEVKAAGGLGTSNSILGDKSGAIPASHVELQSLVAAFAGFATLAALF